MARKIKILIPILLLACGSLRAQLDSVASRLISDSLRQFSLTLDSTITTGKTVNSAAPVQIYPLTLPDNSAGFFTVYWTSFDTVKMAPSMGMRVVECYRVKGNYSIAHEGVSTYSFGMNNVPTATLSYSFVGGMPILQVSGSPGANIRWRVRIDAQIIPL